MALNIDEYLESGVIEAYLTGKATKEEISNLMVLKMIYPEIDEVLSKRALELEELSHILPPDISETKTDDINELTRSKHRVIQKVYAKTGNVNQDTDSQQKYLKIEGASKYMLVDKSWKGWAILILIGLVLLIWLVYYLYHENQLIKVLHQ